MNVKREWLAVIAIPAVVAAVAVGCARAPDSDPAGATVIAATPLAPEAFEPEITGPPVPFDAEPGMPTPPPGVPTGPSDRSAVDTCVDATSANLGLVTAQDSAAAGVAADQLQKLGPPPNVRNAIEYFRGTQGAMFNDPNFATRNQVISDWVQGLCGSLTVPNP